MSAVVRRSTASTHDAQRADHGLPARHACKRASETLGNADTRVVRCGATRSRVPKAVRQSDLEGSRTGSWDVGRSPAAPRTARARQNRWSWSRRHPSSADTGRAGTRSTRRPRRTASSPHRRWSRWCWWAGGKAPRWGLFTNISRLKTAAWQTTRKPVREKRTEMNRMNLQQPVSSELSKQSSWWSHLLCLSMHRPLLQVN